MLHLSSILFRFSPTVSDRADSQLLALVLNYSLAFMTKFAAEIGCHLSLVTATFYVCMRMCVCVCVLF